MKLLTLALPIALAVSVVPAHASVSAGAVNPARVMAVSDLGSFSFAFTRPHPEGSGGGGGTIIGGCSGSPENATVLLAMIAGAGLFFGRRAMNAKTNKRRLALVSA